MADSYAWWQRGIIYQVYPRSFMDDNGDGVGDLRGVTGRLDYLQWLGVDTVWLSPIYPSPMADFGYDVADYTGIHPLFGTLEDFDQLVAAVHQRDLKVILDLVPNHTSDRHPWFGESRTSRENPKRDWYLWRDPAPDGGPPNNWLSNFGGSAWEFDETTAQYYYHAFLKEQPDLNWRNPEVVQAMHDVLRFWFDRGVDGFRVDVIWQMIKDDQFRDNPPDPAYQPGDYDYATFQPLYTTDRPEVHGVIAGMRQVFDEYPERVMIGEIYLPLEQLVSYYGTEIPEVHLPYNFQLVTLPWQARAIAAAIETYEALLPPDAWPNWVLGNHDRSRIATRVGVAQARVAAMLLLTLRGTPTLYYGDEIGMHDVPIPPELVQDPFEKNVPGLGHGRDPERTPMQWDGEEGAGFTTGVPWLPLADDYRTINVAAEGDTSDSLLTFYRQLIALRRAEPALAVGSYRALPATGDLLVYLREAAERRFLVVLNLGAEPDTFANENLVGGGQVTLSTHPDRQGEAVAAGVALDLRPDEGLVIALSTAYGGGEH